MPKMFVTLKEAAKVLKVTEAEMLRLVRSGHFQEFRDRDTLMLKTEQVYAWEDYSNQQSIFDAKKASREAEQSVATVKKRKSDRWEAFWSFVRIMVGK